MLLGNAIDFILKSGKGEKNSIKWKKVGHEVQQMEATEINSKRNDEDAKGAWTLV